MNARSTGSGANSELIEPCRKNSASAPVHDGACGCSSPARPSGAGAELNNGAHASARAAAAIADSARGMAFMVGPILLASGRFARLSSPGGHPRASTLPHGADAGGRVGVDVPAMARQLLSQGTAADPGTGVRQPPLRGPGG